MKKTIVCSLISTLLIISLVEGGRSLRADEISNNYCCCCCSNSCLDSTLATNENVNGGSVNSNSEETDSPTIDDSLIVLDDNSSTGIQEDSNQINNSETDSGSAENNQEAAVDPTTNSENSDENESCQNTRLVINEFVSDPVTGSDEFIELYNFSDQAIDLSEWTVEDGAARQTVLSDDVAARGFFVINKPKGVLNNDGDIIILKCQDQIIDQVTYGNWDDGNKADNAPAVSDPSAVARKTDGVDTNQDNLDWSETLTITPGAPNIINLSTSVVDSVIEDSASPDSISSIVVAEENLSNNSNSGESVGLAAKVIINEILPNPVGADDNEFIELKNTEDQAVDLVGWQVGDESKKYLITVDDFTTTVVPAGDFFLISRQISNIALNNTGGESVFLYNPNDEIVAAAGYTGSAPEGLSYNLDAEGSWVWSEIVTPAAANIIQTPNHAPQASFTITKSSRPKVGEVMIFDASESSDSDGDDLSYEWDFGKGENRVGKVVGYSYATVGKITVQLSVSDGRGGEDISERSFTIYAASQVSAATQKSDEETPVVTTLQEAKKLPEGEVVKVKGLVAVEPGVLGSQVMYLKGSGMQVYSYKKDWPDLQVGDEVEVEGTISQSNGERRIKIAARDDIQVVGHQEEVEPLAVESLSEEVDGYLVKVSGEITEKKSDSFWLDNGQNEFEIYIKDSTGISTAIWQPGQKVEVVGIVSKGKDGLRILPRYESDIKLLENPLSESNIPAGDNKSKVGWYLGAVAGAVILSLAALLYKLKIKKEK
jgi:DNA/RNA endonuclease YhcR with UshA esterase domain